jgi:hypothetical protein
MHGRCGIGVTLILTLYASRTACDTPDSPRMQSLALPHHWPAVA